MELTNSPQRPQSHEARPEVPEYLVRRYGDLTKKWTERRDACVACRQCSPWPSWFDPDTRCPLPEPKWVEIPRDTPGLGDWLERKVKPIAVAFKMDCLDENKKLKPDSGCAKRRAMLNRAGDAVKDLFIR